MVVDVESTDHHQQRVQSEQDPLIQHVVNVPSKQEANVARAQFLAICWSMFVAGWTNSSTGPLLPRIQLFYDVSSLSWPLFLLTIFQNISILQVGLGAASWLFVLLRTVSDIYARLLWRLVYTMMFREWL